MIWNTEIFHSYSVFVGLSYLGLNYKYTVICNIASSWLCYLEPITGPQPQPDESVYTLVL